MKNQAILFQTHNVNDEIMARYRKLENDLRGKDYDVWLLLNVNENKDIYRKFTDSISNVYANNLEDLNLLGYTPICENLLPGSCHFPLLSFFLSHSDYKYYWFVEYDVHYQGNWLKLFDDCLQNLPDYDFLSSYISKYNRGKNGDWNWWDSAKNIGYPTNELLKSFNPICRYSARALTMIDKAQKEGMSAHSEVLIPTLLYHSGFKIGNLGGDGEFTPNGFRNKYYIDNLSAFGGSIRYRPLYTHDEILKYKVENVLFHPLK